MENTLLYLAIIVFSLAILSAPKEFIKAKIASWKNEKRAIQEKLERLAAFEELENKKELSAKQELKALIKKMGLYQFLNTFKDVTFDSFGKNLNGENYRINRKLYEDANTMFLNFADRGYDKWARTKCLEDIKKKEENINESTTN